MLAKGVYFYLFACSAIWACPGVCFDDYLQELDFSLEEHLGDFFGLEEYGSPLQKRVGVVPSTHELVQLCEHSNCMYGKRSVFFTNFDGARAPGYPQAKTWALGHLGAREAFAMYNDCIPKAKYREINEASNPEDAFTPAQDKEFLINMSKTFAWGTQSEEAFVVVPDGYTTPKATSHFLKYEAPLLTRNPYVQRIIMVEYPSNRVKIYWDKHFQQPIGIAVLRR